MYLHFDWCQICKQKKLPKLKHFDLREFTAYFLINNNADISRPLKSSEPVWHLKDEM